MAYVTGRCPSCGGEVQLDESKEKGFCLHCGSAIQVQEAVQRLKVELHGKVAVDGLSTVKQLKENAKRSFDVGQYQNAARDWSKVIDIDSTDYESYWGLMRCYMVENPHARIDNDNTYANSRLMSAYAYAPPSVRKEYESLIRAHNDNAYKLEKEREAEVRAADIKKKKRRNKRNFIIWAIMTFLGTLIGLDYVSDSNPIIIVIAVAGGISAAIMLVIWVFGGMMHWWGD